MSINLKTRLFRSKMYFNAAYTLYIIYYYTSIYKTSRIKPILIISIIYITEKYVLAQLTQYIYIRYITKQVYIYNQHMIYYYPSIYILLCKYIHNQQDESLKQAHTLLLSAHFWFAFKALLCFFITISLLLN